MASGGGSLEWARRTHGRLSTSDQAALIVQGVRRQARSILPRLGSRAQAVLDLDGYRPPDSAVAREAEERGTRSAIVARHPRHRMKDRFKALMDGEVVLHPDSRAAFFTKWLGFKGMIERAPFDD